MVIEEGKRGSQVGHRSRAGANKRLVASLVSKHVDAGFGSQCLHPAPVCRVTDLVSGRSVTIVPPGASSQGLQGRPDRVTGQSQSVRIGHGQLDARGGEMSVPVAPDANRRRRVTSSWSDR